MRRDVFNAVLAELFGAAARSGAPVSRILSRGLVLRVRLENGRREVLAYRDPGGASQTEADVVRRSCGFPTHDPVPFDAGHRHGWRIAEMLPDEVEALKLEAAAANVGLADRQRARCVDYALSLLFQLNPTVEDGCESRRELWREGLEQFPAELEGKIVGFEAELATRAAQPVARVAEQEGMAL